MRISGLASGMDTESIVKDMMTVQKMPMDKLVQQKTFTEWQQEAVREQNLTFSSLRTSASNLRLQSTFNAYKAETTGSSSAKITATTQAMNGSYDVRVNALATSAKMTSELGIENMDGNAAKSTDLIGVAGTITVKGTTGDVAVAITADMTFAAVAKKMQDATAGSEPALRVNFDNTTSRFFMASKELGSAQNFSLEFTDEKGKRSDDLGEKITGEAQDKVTSTAATNGSVTVDGIRVDGLTSNQTTVNGLSIQLMAIDAAGESTSVSVQSNPEKPVQLIKDFVESYNKAIDDLQKKVIEKRYTDFQPLSDEQKSELTENEIELWEEKARSGLLRNDPIMKSALEDLRRAFMDKVSGLADGNLSHLSQIGINTGSYTEGGKLFIDEDKLSEALTNKPDEVMALFTTRDAAGDGVGARVYDTLNDIITKLSAKAGSPSSSVDNSTLSQKLKRMDTEISRWQDRLITIEDRYWKQFTAMEKALSQMNSQSTWMQQSLFGGS
ncbi:flagellar filament capping protein FliD [Planococcus halocryophilus]|uniref:flagellar filament capping protein FliD n=1 Tax=Planococcus halocryophilus TaxID=1215089 RepID=UPI001F1004F0|nr:flagellar filament capping protein FliD [Planococcus halocryophilus]MCH4827615.1 flagellar filament capping protein FliD [Planococcus halocryophilus]